MANSIIKKITIKDVCGTVQKPESATTLMRVVGIAKDFDTGTTTFGEFIKFKGQFRAINIATGEAFDSGAMILPDIANNLIFGALSSEGANAVEFAFDLAIKPSKSPTGYDYTVQSLIESKEADPLSALLAVAPDLPALPAPEKPAKKAVKDEA